MDYTYLLKTWCDGLIDRQINDAYDKDMNGGFLCPACKTVHGRGDNAVYPFYYMYYATKDEKYRAAAKRCFDFQENYLCSDGGVYNDGSATWKAVTVFSAISYLKTLIHFSHLLEDKKAFEKRTLLLCNWVYNNLTSAFPSNINYQCASALCMALAGDYFGNSDYTVRAKEALGYGVEHFTDNGILFGEIKPHNKTSQRGCRAIDIGYNAEESVPALAEAAVVLEDEKAQEFFADVLLKQLDFMLPDGAWDNSFSCRNYKWTYYGSRTSDGCAGVYMMYSHYNAVFKEAAYRNIRLMGKCTFDGLLSGGRQYKKAGEKPCVHHSFTHAVALTDVLLLDKKYERQEAPMDDFSDRVKYYPELDSFKVYRNGFLADFSCYDINRDSMTGGVAFARGGSMTLLYHKEKGLISTASVFAYPPLAEPTNQQLSLRPERIASLTPRAQVVKGSAVYASCLDNDARVSFDGDRVVVNCTLSDIHSNKADKISFLYTFYDNRLNIKIHGEKFSYIFPLISKAEIKSDNPYSKRNIFSLIGGFCADEYTFESQNGKVEIDIIL